MPSMSIPLLTLAAEERAAERKAWARFLKAERSANVAAEIARVEGDEWAQRLADANVEHALAKQALRDLGVDVDALLGES
jgi:hypothetical protein